MKATFDPYNPPTLTKVTKLSIVEKKLRKPHYGRTSLHYLVDDKGIEIGNGFFTKEQAEKWVGEVSFFTI